MEHIFKNKFLEDEHFNKLTKFALLAISYLEQRGIIPRRLISEGRLIWKAYMKNLRLADLFELTVRDISISYPHLFSFMGKRPQDLWELRTLSEGALDETIRAIEKEDLTALPEDDLYTLGNKLLGQQFPEIDQNLLNRLDLSRNTFIAELPEGRGLPTFLLYQKYPFLDPFHNFKIFSETVEGEMLAAWALLLIGQKEIPSDVIVKIKDRPTDKPCLERMRKISDEYFDLVLILNPPQWLSKDNLNSYIRTGKAIWL